jgi:hypothetical protein
MSRERCGTRVEHDGACQLETVLYSERVADGRVAALLPINALRNAATLPARTEFVAMLDVDLLPSRTFLPSFKARRHMPHAAGPTAAAIARGISEHPCSDMMFGMLAD